MRCVCAKAIARKVEINGGKTRLGKEHEASEEVVSVKSIKGNLLTDWTGV